MASFFRNVLHNRFAYTPAGARDNGILNNLSNASGSTSEAAPFHDVP
jgi:hypothetical protein